MKKSQDRWDGAHVRLKRLYDERAPKGMTQAQFGAKFGLGTKGMVWQYLTGYRPLNFEATAKFAKALGCTIHDISPDMAQTLRDDVLPVLGKALRRAAMVLLTIALQQLAPSDAYASSIYHNVCQATHCAARWLWRLACRILATCAPTHQTAINPTIG